MRPVRAKALNTPNKNGNSIAICKASAYSFKAFALTGRIVCDPQKPRAMPWAKSFCPFRACCLYEPFGRAAYMGFWPLWRAAYMSFLASGRVELICET